MRHMIKVEVPATIETRHVRTTCDLCNTTIESEHGKVADINVRARVGTEGYDYGSTVETAFDICTECFDETLLPFLKSKGALPRITEVGY